MKDDLEFVWLKGEMYVGSITTNYFYTREEIEAAYLVYCSVLAKVSHVRMEDRSAWRNEFRRMKEDEPLEQPRWQRHAVRVLDLLVERWDPEATPRQPWRIKDDEGPVGHGQCALCILPAYGCVVCAPFEPSPDADDSPSDRLPPAPTGRRKSGRERRCGRARAG